MQTALAELVSEMERLTPNTPRAIRYTAAEQLYNAAHNSSDRVWCWSASSPSRPHGILLADARRAHDLSIAPCNILLISVLAETAEARQSLLFELHWLLLLTDARHNSLILTGKPHCEATREKYLASFWSTFTEQCWFDVWSQYVDEGLLRHGRCLRTGEYGEHSNHRWCFAAVTRKSLCGGHDGAHGQSLLNGSPERCVPAQLVTFKALSKAWVRPKYGIPTLRHQQNRHFRYFSAFECNAQQMIRSATDTASRTLTSNQTPALVRNTDLGALEGVCLLFKDDVFESWVAGMTSEDGVNFVGDPRLVVPKTMEHTFVNRWGRPSLHLHIDASTRGGNNQIEFPNTKPARRYVSKPTAISMSHNLAVTYHNNSFVFVGGTVHKQHLAQDTLRSQKTSQREISKLSTLTVEDSSSNEEKRNSNLRAKGAHRGIWLARSPSLWLSNVKSTPSSSVSTPSRTTLWTDLRLIIDGQHPGCVERRDHTRLTWLTPSLCEYDGRLALVYFKSRYLLYARANPAAQGQRFVQLATSVDSYSWSPFQMITMDGYNYTEGNVYFWAVQVNPVHEGSLVALFPLVHRLQGCIGVACAHANIFELSTHANETLSFSFDGLHWSKMNVALRCGAVGDRSLHHPASPAMVRAKGKTSGLVHIYIQHNVPSIGLDRMTPWSLYKERVLVEPRSSVMRYSLSKCELINVSRSALSGMSQTINNLAGDDKLPEPCNRALKEALEHKLCDMARSNKRSTNEAKHRHRAS